MASGRDDPGHTPSRVGEVARLFLKLGTIAFGGPAAHIAMMDDEVVRKRGWLTRERFLDLLGATNLIPGPNSTEMAIHLGLLRAGWRGLLVAGACFILPAMTITLALAWAYVRYGALPEVSWLLYGVKPVIIADRVPGALGVCDESGQRTPSRESSAQWSWHCRSSGGTRSFCCSSAGLS